jgi:GT2 family glycosyltransferase
MDKGRIGVVTVTYNSGQVLPDFLRCLWSQTCTNFLLLAVDNASRDGTIELLKECGDERLIVIANPDNRGVAEGNNQGIRQALEAGCSSVLLLNNDTEFDETLLERLAAGLETYACDMVCPKMLFFDEPDRIWAAGGFFQPRLGYRTLHYGEGDRDRGQFDQARAVTYTPTCCVLICADLFARIGLMDARYFVYSDDADFMYRALKAASKLYYMPSATLLHKVGRLTGGDSSPFNIRYSVRNRAYFKLKHCGRISASFWNLMYRAYYLAKFLSFKSSFATLKLRQRAISEAYKMPREHESNNGYC